MKRKLIIVLVIICIIAGGSYIKYHRRVVISVSDEKNQTEEVKIQRDFYDAEYNTNILSNINMIELHNDKIKYKYEFVFMADLHASIMDESELDEKIRNSLVERNNLFTTLNSNHISSDKIFPEIIDYTNNINANALLLGGDIIDSPSNSNIQFLRENLKRVKTDYLYTFGNHDWTFEWDYQTKETEEKYYPVFLEFMEDNQVSYLEYEDLIILAINNGKGKIEEIVIDRVKEILEKKKPTIIMLHVPIATENIVEAEKNIRNRVTSLGGNGVKTDEATQSLIDMIVSDEYNVFYILAGHVHFAVNDNINEKIIEEVTDPAYDGKIDLIKIN